MVFEIMELGKITKGLRLVLAEEGGTSRGEGKKPVRKESQQNELDLRDKGESLWRRRVSPTV